MSIELAGMVIGSAAIKLVSQAISVYKERKELEGEISTKALPGTQKLEAASFEMSPELFAKLKARLDEAPSDFKESVRLSRTAAGRFEGDVTPVIDSSIGAAALAISPARVFEDARKRIELVFKLNLGLAIVLAFILLGGLAGAVISGLLFKSGAWAVTFGGISAADLLGLYIFKPFTAINSALVATQRLDAIHLRLHEQLKVCEQHSNLSQRIKCQTTVWETMQAELAILAG